MNLTTRLLVNITLILSLAGGFSYQVSNPISSGVKTEQVENTARPTRLAISLHQRDNKFKKQNSKPGLYCFSTPCINNFVKVALRHNKILITSFKNPSLISAYIPRSMVASSSLS